MNTSPRKKTHSAFRPVNTLSSSRPVNTLSSSRLPPQPPSTATFTSSVNNTHHSRISIGDTSSLFDTTDGSLEIIDYPSSWKNNMARERRPSADRPSQSTQPSTLPPQSSQPSTRPAQSSQSSNLPPQNVAPPTPLANKPSLQQPEFGKASPLRNPLRPDSHSNLFVQNKREHQRPSNGFRQPSAQTSSGHASSNRSFYLPGQKPQPAQNANPLYAPAANSGAVRIAVPTNPRPRDIPAAPRPVFNSAIGPHTTFQPIRPVQPRKPTIDLTNDDDDDEDGFDPDAALKEDRFGAADPYAYIDPGQTSQNIKALLEGAFDEDDGDKPRMRLRKRAKKQEKQKEEKKVLSLEDKLRKLELDAAPKDEVKKTEPEEEEEDEEDGTVEGLNIKLLPHQVEGVSWMIEKESGVKKKNGVLPKGGILADDMGLGKTVQSVSLILLNSRPEPDFKPENSKVKVPGKEVGKGTLVVAPLALIKQWESEIKTKVDKEHALRVLVHHGPSRTKFAAELKKYDVVITTYQILASEYAGSSDHADGAKVGCYGVHWYRVILDEAHSIKNRNAKSTQACYALRSWYRWCLTGTPMQNNLDELQSLICFLQIKPYNNLGTWKEQITIPMKNGKGHYAIKRVQYFLKGFMKRRTKDILKEEGALTFGGKTKDGEKKKSPGMKIVERKVETITCKLDPKERDFYDQLQSRAEKRLKDLMSGDKNDYIGALVLLLRLRQACNHPKLVSGAMGKDKDALSTGQPNPSQTPRKGGASADDGMDALADMLGGLDVKSRDCDICRIQLTPEEVKSGAVRCPECDDVVVNATPKKSSKKEKKEKKHKPKPEPRAAPPRRRNRRIITDSDDEDGEGEGDWLVDESQQKMLDLGRAGGTDDEDAEGGGETIGTIDTLSGDEDESRSEPSESEEEVGDISYSGPSGVEAASTKIRRLLRILHADSPNHKIIVFSQFTSMLDLIEPHLSKSSIRYVRYDGGMRNDAREASLNSLRNDPRTRVLLCSLKCGSLGLNLTAASRVVLIEPFWNPFVEEQAIDRVHRLNQTVDVHVYKLTVANTVEERIIELQEKKRELAKAAIEGGKAVGKLTMKDIMNLFSTNPIADPEEEKTWSNDSKKLTDFSRPGASSQRSSTGPSPSAPARNDRRAGWERGTKRITNEDPVYGRR